MGFTINVATVSGNLTRDPELKQTAGGTSVLNLRVAVSNRRKDGDEWVDDPSYLDVVVFGRQAEALSRTLAKGGFVCASGRLNQRSWEARDGSKRSVVEIVATDVTTGPRQQPGARPVAAAPAPQAAAPALYDQEIPF